MVKRILWLFFTFLICYCPSVFALENDENTLKQIASNINYDYSYIENNNSVTFTIRFTNVNEDLYIQDVNNNKNYMADGNKEIIISGYSPNKKYKFQVKNKNEGNPNVLILPTWDGTKYYDKIITLPGEPISSAPLYTIYINLPAYNPYYNDEVCKGFEEYRLCKKWTNITLTHEEFINEVKKAKEKNNDNNKVVNEEKERTFIDYIIDNIRIISIILVGLLVIIILAIKYVRGKQDSFEGW